MLCTIARYPMMNSNFDAPSKNSNNRRSSSTEPHMPPPPMPAGVSLADRTLSVPAVAARHRPTNETRSVSFSDLVSFNFPVGSNNHLPGRIVSQVTRRSSIESLNDFDLSFSSLASSYTAKTSTADPMLEPNQIFDTKSSSFSTCSNDDLRTILHRACQQFPRKKAIVRGALKKDPSAVRRRAFIFANSNKNSTCISTPEPYQLPINIALAHKASLDVLDLLVKADPTQLAQKDGIHGANSLCLALEKRPNDIAVLGMFLVSNPQLVKQTCDNHHNTPLHVACHRGSSLPIVRQLFQLHPAALNHRNESGKTPLDILQQQALVCRKARQSLDFLTSVQQQQQQTQRSS